VMTGIVNQKVEPTQGFETAPIWPPSTATCLLQMLRPSPVPPARLGLFMSSSVPCKATQWHINELFPVMC
jgi:hypothetical protein